MFSLIWFFLLFSVSESRSLHCDEQKNMICLNITAATKLCAALKHFSEANSMESIDWYKCDSPNCEKLPGNFTVCPSFSPANVKFTVFQQKPVMSLNLTKGNKANLTCTVPFCLGTKPQFTWVWRRAECNDTEVTKKPEEFTCKNVTDNVTQTYTSTLTFNVSAEHHNTNITCRVTLADVTVIEETSEVKNSSFFMMILNKVIKDPTSFLVVFGTGVLIGMLLLSIIACFVVKCYRLCHKNKKKSRNLNESLEMVTSEALYERDEDGIQDVQEDRIQDPEAAQGGAEPNEPTKEAADSDVNDTAMAPKETVYSNIDFSAMKKRNPADEKKVQETTETEYAEIKKGEAQERQVDDEAEGEMLEGSAEKEEIKEEDEEVKQGLLAEEVVREDVPLHSSVDEILDEN